jgi:hypothetical protein
MGLIYKYQTGNKLTVSTPEEWEKEIKLIEQQIGNPSKWTLQDYNLLQNKLNEYKSWRETTEKGKAVVDYHNEPNEYVVPLPSHLKDIKNNEKLIYGTHDPETMFFNKYNTSLDEKEINEFDKWIEKESAKKGRNVLMDKGAYDIQGFWKSGDWKNVDSDGHGTDTWKKPNHPTFSNQSKYHGADGFYGGNWTEKAGYQPSKQTLELYSPDYYEWLFKSEPNRPEHLDLERYKSNKNIATPLYYKKGGLIYKHKDGNKKVAPAESTSVAKPQILKLPKYAGPHNNDPYNLNYMYANELLKKYNVTVDSSSNVLRDIGLPSAAYYNPLTRTINYKNIPYRDPKIEFTEIVMKELPHAIQADSMGVVPFLKNTIIEGLSDVITNKKEHYGWDRYDENDKIEGHAHNVLEEKLIKERNDKLYKKETPTTVSTITKFLKKQE